MMKKPIRDSRGTPLKLHNMLGQGTFGKVYRAETEDGQVLAAKIPYDADDLNNNDRDATDTKILCARLLREQGHLLKGMPPPLRPDVKGIVDGGNATPCLLMELMPGSTSSRFTQETHFTDLVDTLAIICRGLSVYHQAGMVHGNLKPGNIFIEGDDTVRFTDPCPENGRLMAEAVSRLPGWSAKLPPEILDNIEGSCPLNLPSIDTFAVVKIFYQAILAPGHLSDSLSLSGLFVGPIEKSLMEPFNEALEARHERDHGNPHTKELFFRRCSALINRALSADTAPSPPFRFYRAIDLAQRFEELKTLFHPTFEQMGPIVLDRPPGNQSFVAGENIRFTLSFKVQGGLTNPDLLNCFIYVRDLNKEEKVKNLDQEVLPVHDGNRFRCEFRLGGLATGEYLLRVGMGLKGTPGKPIPRDILLLVEPPAIVETDVPPPAAPPRPELPPREAMPERPTAPKAPAPAPKQSIPVKRPAPRAPEPSPLPTQVDVAAPPPAKASANWPRDAKASSKQWPASAPEPKVAPQSLPAANTTQWPEPVKAPTKAAAGSLKELAIETPKKDKKLPSPPTDTDLSFPDEEGSEAQQYYDKARTAASPSENSAPGALLSNRDMLLIAGAVFLVVLGAILWLS